MDAYAYAEAHFERFLEELKAYLRIPSVSTLSKHAPDLERAAQWTLEQILALKGATGRIYQTEQHPIVYGEWLGAPNAPTVLFYGHYDVQPAEPLEEWEGDPFEPIIRDGLIIGRGAADDKGQLFLNLKAFEAILAAHGSLPINVKFLIEGEEEIGSVSLQRFVAENRDLLRADVAVISDTTMLSRDQPALSTSFRGTLYMELTVRGPAFDLHSGQHGGVVHNPIQALCQIISTFHNADGSVAVAGFYDRVRLLDAQEKAALAALYSEEELIAETGAPQAWGEPQFSLRERIVARPTLELNGILGGWTGEGRKTVLPAKAMAKISCRLVPDQDPHEIEGLIRAHLALVTPPTVTVMLAALSHGYPIVIPTDSPYMRVAAAAYQRGFGVPPILMRKGGSLPIVSTFSSGLGLPVLLMGYGLPTDRVHGPNERFELICFRRGLLTAIALYEGLGAAT